MFKKPTRFFEELINSNGKGRTVMTAVKDFTPLIGGIPIMADDQIIGGVGVSGAISAQQDEELALAGAAAAKEFAKSQTASAHRRPSEPVHFKRSCRACGGSCS